MHFSRVHLVIALGSAGLLVLVFLGYFEMSFPPGGGEEVDEVEARAA